MPAARRQGAAIALALAALALAGCPPGGQAPDEAVRLFWVAIAEQDFERARAASTAESEAPLRELTDRYPLVAVTFGETLLGERRAVVETRGTVAGRQSEIGFETHLVRPDAGWRVDLEGTRRSLVHAALVNSLQEMEKTLDRGSDILEEFLEQNAVELSEAMRRAVEELEGPIGEPTPEPTP